MQGNFWEIAELKAREGTLRIEFLGVPDEKQTALLGVARTPPRAFPEPCQVLAWNRGSIQPPHFSPVPDWGAGHQCPLQVGEGAVWVLKQPATWGLEKWVYYSGTNTEGRGDHSPELSLTILSILTSPMEINPWRLCFPGLSQLEVLLRRKTRRQTQQY